MIARENVSEQLPVMLDLLLHQQRNQQQERRQRQPQPMAQLSLYPEL
jgi:hypothetical protein